MHFLYYVAFLSLLFIYFLYRSQPSPTAVIQAQLEKVNDQAASIQLLSEALMHSYKDGQRRVADLEEDLADKQFDLMGIKFQMEQYRERLREGRGKHTKC